MSEPRIAIPVDEARARHHLRMRALHLRSLLSEALDALQSDSEMERRWVYERIVDQLDAVDEAPDAR